MIDFIRTLGTDLEKSGELVSAEGLADAPQAKTVRFTSGGPVASDGPFAEAKESLAGYWVVDVDGESRALEIASRIVAFAEGPIEVRQIMSAPAEL